MRRNEGGRCPGKRIGGASETERHMSKTAKAEMDGGWGRGRGGAE